MADYDSHMIKPVQGLQNIAGLDPAKRRKERNSRKQLHEKSKEQDESAKDRDTTLPQERAEDKSDRDNCGIDYCA